MTVDRHALLDDIPSKPLYPPSWIDRMGIWIEGLPGPTWLAYLVCFLGFALLMNVVFWIDGSAQLGSFDPYITTYAVLAVYWPALYHYLTRVAGRSLHAFRPLLNASDAHFLATEYELKTLPSREGWLTIPLGLGLAIVQALGDPGSFGSLVPKTILPSLGDVVITTFIATTFLCLLIRSIRQLRMVNRLHASAMNINLLELDPARSFSMLTARTGIGVILLVVVSYAYDPLAFGSAASVGLSTAVVIAAIAIFVVPMMGLQNRIEHEKDRALRQIHGLLRSAEDRLHDRIKSDSYESMAELDHALQALARERDLIKAVPTWPWNPRTLRGFGSALLLPIFLWLVTRILERLF